MRGDELPDLIRGCSERGWRWLVENLERFRPADPFVPENMKKIGELSLLYALTMQWGAGDRRVEVEAIGAFLFEYCCLPETFNLARKRPSYFTAYAGIYLALRSTGVRIDGFEEAISFLRRAGYPDASERMPFRQMEVEYSLWKAGLREIGPRLEDCPGTSFGLFGNPAYLVNWEIYSITHVLFYLTDFCGPDARIGADHRDAAVRLVEGLLVHYWRLKDWDLAGELLLNLLALGRHNLPLYEDCLRSTLSAWHGDGMLPGPHFPESAGSDLEAAFDDCYHTTLVGLILCGGHMHRARESGS